MFVRTFGIALCVLLAGCQVQFNSEIYAQDVFSDENLTFPAQLKLEINSCTSDTRSKTENSVLALFSSVSKAKIRGCEEVGMNSMLAVDFAAQLASAPTEHDLMMLRERAEDGSSELRISLKSTFLYRVRALLKENHQSLDYDDVSIRFTLHNDERNPVSVHIISGWLNGQAGQHLTTTLNRREKVEILSSNVVSALTLKEQKPLIAVLRKE